MLESTGLATNIKWKI